MPSIQEIQEMFAPGQPVQVWRNGVFQYVGTVVGYTRCESFQVREPEHGTVCDYLYTQLTAV